MDTKNRNFRNTAWKSRSLYTFLLLKCFSWYCIIKSVRIDYLIRLPNYQNDSFP
jgi:hypothetical protein